MERKIKYKIGDDVWIALTKVLKANIKDISRYKNGDIKYFCHYYDGGIGFVPEKEIFATKEKAEAECRRRNGKK